jgi:hypothetical protein
MGSDFLYLQLCHGIDFGVIPHQINTEKRHFKHDPPELNDFCEIVVQIEISIPAKFYCFMPTGFLTADVQFCKKKKRAFFGTSCLRKSGITSARIKIHSSFYAHFKANEMPFPMTYCTNIFSIVM